MATTKKKNKKEVKPGVEEKQLSADGIERDSDGKILPSTKHPYDGGKYTQKSCPMNSPERQELVNSLRTGFTSVLDAHGITEDFLAQKMLKEFKAKDYKVLPGESRGESTIKKVPNWEVRQKARMDAHKLRGDYPATKQEVKITPGDYDPVDLSQYRNEKEQEESNTGIDLDNI